MILNKLYRDPGKHGASVLQSFLICLLTLAAFGILFYVYLGSLLSGKHTDLFLNPDLNTYPFMLKNLLYQHGHFFDWHMGSAIYFIPELAFLYISSHFFTNPFTNLIFNAVFQAAFFCLIIPAVFSCATKTKAGFRLGILSVLIFFIVLFVIKPFQDIYGHDGYLTAIVGIGFHFGTALLIFTSLLLFLKITDSPSRYITLLFALLLILSGLSDPLFYIYFTLPLLATLCICYFLDYFPRAKFRLLSITIISCFIISYLTYKFLPFRNHKIDSSMAFHAGYAYAFFKTFFVFVQKNIFGGIIWILFFILAPVSLWKSIKEKNREFRLINYIMLFQWLTILLVTPIIILTLGQILPSNYDIIPTHSILSHPVVAYGRLELLPYRYLINYLIGPTCIAFPLLLYKHTHGFKPLENNRLYGFLLILCICIMQLLKPHQIYQNNLFTFQPKLASCFDRVAGTYHLTNGVANSYYAEVLINAYNAHQSHIALVSDELAPTGWQLSLHMYLLKNYDFAVSEDRTIENQLSKRFGKPSAIVACPDNLFNREYIFIYQNHQMNNVFLPYQKILH